MQMGTRAMLMAGLVLATGLCTEVVRSGGVDNMPVMFASAALPALAGLVAFMGRTEPEGDDASEDYSSQP